MNETLFDPRDVPLPLDYFERKYQVSRTTLWRWRRAGLPTLQVGSKIFCRESDFLSFLERMNNQAINSASLKSGNQGKR